MLDIVKNAVTSLDPAQVGSFLPLLVQKRMKINEALQGWILDGYPRKTSQAEQLHELLGSIHKQLQAVYFIDVPDQEIIDRICGE